MALVDIDDADLSDEWVEHHQQLPTIRMSAAGSLSGSVNILNEKATDWSNVNAIVTQDLLTKKPNSLQSLFHPPTPPADDPIYDVLSTVEEAPSEEERAAVPDRAMSRLSMNAWNSLRISMNAATNNIDKENYGVKSKQSTSRSADGTIPNFSFPRAAVQPQVEEVETASDSTPQPSEDEDEAPRTPKQSPSKTGSAFASPVKSPLKIFQDPDTFTQDRMGQLIGLLGSAPPQDKSSPGTKDTARSQQSLKSENTDVGPERKKVKTHEPKGSVTLQNMYDNAARMAAKLKAKGGGLGKGLPRASEDLGKRSASIKHRQISGFEGMNIPAQQFAREPQFGLTSTKSHFSDWDSVANTESRAVSGSTDTVVPPSTDDDAIAASSLRSPNKAFASPRDTHSVHSKSSSDVRRPHMQNFPPTELNTLRQGDMIFSRSRQCWRHVSESDPDLEMSVNKITESDHMSQYPDELDVSDSTTVPTNEKTTDCRARSSSPASEQGGGQDVCEVFSNDLSETPILNEIATTTDDQPPAAIAALSRTTNKLIAALNTRYGTGPWQDVQRLDLNDLELDSLIGLNHYFPGLQCLDISNNNLTSLEGLPSSIQVLRASQNNLASHRLSFAHLPALQVLDLNHNELEDLDSLTSLKFLHYLSVDNNKLHCADGLRSLPHLTTFNARNNQLESLDLIDFQAHMEFEHLERLDLAHNQLHTIVGLETLKELISLDLSHNELEDLDICEVMPHLRVLKASSNNLQHVDTGVIPKIRVLYLDDNSISEIDAPSCLKYIESFSLRRQGVPQIELDLNSLREVQKLYLGGNDLQKFTFPTAFLSLKYLELAGTQCTALPTDLARMAPNLRVLNVSHNQISDVHEVLGLDRLERLLVCNNKLSSVEGLCDVLASLPHLRALDLRANKCTERFYAPISPSNETDYFAHNDGSKALKESIQAWQIEDDKFSSTLSPLMRRRKEAYQNMIWSVCRALKWHDGNKLEAQQLMLADSYIDNFPHSELTEENLLNEAI